MKEENQFPLEWDERRVREVLEYYETQTDVEAAAEHEAALARPNHTLMPIPHELVPRVHRSSPSTRRSERADAADGDRDEDPAVTRGARVG